MMNGVSVVIFYTIVLLPIFLRVHANMKKLGLILCMLTLRYKLLRLAAHYTTCDNMGAMMLGIQSRLNLYNCS